LLAIIGGSSLLGSTIFEEWEEEILETPYGEVSLKRSNDLIFLQRHGSEFLPPHRINHRANIWALKKKGAKRIVAINSTGSLKESLRPGTFLIPHDFFCPWVIPTLFDRECRFFIPRMDEELMELIYRIGKDSGIDVKKGGIYIQTLGPRFETVAEIDFFKNIGDVVGMTLASEATLALECEISYASLCSIDNYCHGIGEERLKIEGVQEFQRMNLLSIEKFLKTLIERERR